MAAAMVEKAEIPRSVGRVLRQFARSLSSRDKDRMSKVVREG